MLGDGIIHPGICEDIAEDLGHAFAMDMGLELLEFCITPLENELTVNNQSMEDMNDEELQVSFFLSRML